MRKEREIRNESMNEERETRKGKRNEERKEGKKWLGEMKMLKGQLCRD